MAPARLENPYLHFQNYREKELVAISNVYKIQNIVYSIMISYRVVYEIVIQFNDTQGWIFLQHLSNSFCSLHNDKWEVQIRLLLFTKGWYDETCSRSRWCYFDAKSKLTSSPNALLLSCSFWIPELSTRMSHKDCR